MSGFNFDPRTVKPDEGFVVIPGGQYTLVIYKTDMKPTKDDQSKWYLSASLKVVGGPHDGHVFADNMNLVNPSVQTVEIAMARLSAYCHAVGYLQPVNIPASAPEGMAIPALHNIQFVADVGVQGEYNRIKKVMPAAGPQVGGMTPAPAQGFGGVASTPQPGGNPWGAPPPAAAPAPVFAPNPVSPPAPAPQPAAPVLDPNSTQWLAHIIAQNDAGAHPSIPQAVAVALVGLVQTGPVDATGNVPAAVLPAGRAYGKPAAPAPVVAPAPVAAVPVPGVGFPSAAPVQQAPQAAPPAPNGGWQPQTAAAPQPPANAPWAPTA